MMHNEPTHILDLHNAEAAALSSLAALPFDQFRSRMSDLLGEGARLLSWFALPQGDILHFIAALAHDHTGRISLLRGQGIDTFDSLTNAFPETHLFERELHEQWGVEPQGHPWLKPVRFLPADANTKRERPEIGRCDYFRVEGDDVHEVAVGPVHAGVIEPGHFRFQCHGENVLHLEISLGYQHRGIERALIGGPKPLSLHYQETASGDTTIGHTLAYCQALEALADVKVPLRAQVLRCVMLELERIANHIGDLGALSGDVGFLPTASYCGAIRGEVLNLTAVACGNRFGRGMVKPGGVAWDLDADLAEKIERGLQKAGASAQQAVELMLEKPSVNARFEGTGQLSATTARQIGLVGPAARACGIHRDIRHDFAHSHYRFAQIPVRTWHTGDVFARAFVRWLEVQQSIAFISEQLRSMPPGPLCVPMPPLTPGRIAVSLVEGWRGEICHVAITGDDGRFLAYKMVDPSFHNWFGLALAMRNQPISDFPLCNKSFNLSYCGFDL